MGHTISKLANPALFMRVTKPIIPISGILALVLIGIATVMAFFFSPPDHRQGESVRIMYVHVPAAWMSMQTYFLIAVSSLVGFVWRHRLADVAARVMAPIGLGFTVLALVTGSAWGRATWGVWWDWDPRLISMLVLMFVYIGYIVMWHAIENEAQAARLCALLAMLGVVMLPIIKFSVDWWDSIHQKASVIREGGPSMPASMLWPLLIMALGFVALSVFYTLIRTHAALAMRKTADAEKRRAPSTAILEPETP